MDRALEQARARGTGAVGATDAATPGKATQVDNLPDGDAGAPLPADAAAHFGRELGHDVRGARIHTGPAAERAADAVDARAFARGRDIYIGAGESADPSPGNELVAHELAHVVQHERGEVPASDRPSSASDPVEKDAHAMTSGAARPVPRIQLRDIPAPRAILRWQRQGGQSTGPLTDAEQARLVQILSGEFGLAPDEIGDLSTLATLPDARIDAAIGVIRWLRQSSHRVTSAWGQHLDDIGSPTAIHARGREAYPNILAFADELNRRSPGGDYVAFRRRMPQTRLAGWTITVNARALYFAAAAQVAMDERGRDAGATAGQAGHGHWVPAGGFFAMFRDLKTALRELAFAPSRRGPPRLRTQPVDGGVAILATIQSEVRRMLAELAAQEAGQNTQTENAGEHEERNLRAVLLPRRAEIQGIQSPTRDEDVPAAAQALLEAIGDLPYRTVATHEAGATDPHGTDHALGIAFDMFDGNDGRNMPVPHGVWPFFHYLIENNAGSYGLTGSERPTSDMAPPQVLRALARLLVERGDGTLRSLNRLAQTDGAELAADHHVRDERHEIARIREELRGSLRARRATLQRALTSPSTSEAERQRVRRELDAIELDLGAIATAGTASLRRIAEQHAAQLRALAQTPSPGPYESTNPLEHIGPDESPNPLSPVLTELANVSTATTLQADRDLRHQAMQALATPGVREFVVRGTQRLFYDQPDTMVAAMEGVASHDRTRNPNFHAFQGTHHWAVAPRGIVDNADTYRSSLGRDMAQRSPAQLERILSVMAESEGGRRALFGASPDVELQTALTARLGAGSFNAIMTRVQARVVQPYEQAPGQHPTAGDDLRSQLRDMGFYLASSRAPRPGR